MNAHTNATLARRIMEPLLAAPWMLLAYIFFAVSVTIGDFALLPFAPETFRAWLVPYTGWVPAMFYAYILFFALMLVYQPRGRRAMRSAVALMLFLQIVWGVCEYSFRSMDTFGNPYLTISAWRLVWTMIIPCLWIMVLFSPRMNRFCPKAHEPSAA
jgi:hypothetical protein